MLLFSLRSCAFRRCLVLIEFGSGDRNFVTFYVSVAWCFSSALAFRFADWFPMCARGWVLVMFEFLDDDGVVWAFQRFANFRKVVLGCSVCFQSLDCSGLRFSCEWGVARQSQSDERLQTRSTGEFAECFVKILFWICDWAIQNSVFVKENLRAHQGVDATTSFVVTCAPWRKLIDAWRVGDWKLGVELWTGFWEAGFSPGFGKS